ncbi:hypothetical protein [Lactobacillus jensenii]|uniref:Uncharacterized protein n=1 Tax=Lactobacillus jensenii TaxID=109790 RepID=A0A5N1IFL4_LACJE|nr:hypothetical protein [Lactobacillus jensenii]ERJ44134.1 hypothetical protein N581_07870 [Lactobacillus jensenii MD IIE-70(2)]KAA9324442.1 hypothetical protein F6H94_00310 [Lactobacillus jensenii]TVV06194.1 hypothetical protein FOF79_00190 [Lactobacillus jensenii]DAQ86134.1 MAG TPA: hypothetical protein [Caudoviricetes sp.]
MLTARDRLKLWTLATIGFTFLVFVLASVLVVITESWTQLWTIPALYLAFIGSICLYCKI